MLYRSLLVMLVLAGSLCGAVAAGASKYSLDGTVSDIKFGTHIMGPERTPEELEGHVVLVLRWCQGCSKVTACIPRVQRSHKEYEPQGLIVIGMYTGDGDQSEFLRNRGVTYTMQNGGKVAIYDGLTIMLPHVYIFDHTGACVYRGSARHEKALNALRETMKRAPAPAFAKTKLIRLQHLSDSMKAGRPPHSVFAKATKLATHEDEEIAAEANLAIEALNSFGQRKLDRAALLKETRPAKCLEALTAIVRDFRGMEAAQTARDTMAELRNDEAFATELRAHQMLGKLKQLEKRLRPIRTAEGPDITSERFRKKNAATLGSIAKGIRAMRATFPDSTATAEAEGLGKKYGIVLAD